MKIGMNGRFLLHPYTGIGQYTLNLLMAMAKLDPSIEWVIGVPEKKGVMVSQSNHDITLRPPPRRGRQAQGDTGTYPDTVHSVNLHLLEIPLIRQIPTHSFRNFFWEQVQLPRALKKANVDLIHYPYPACPALAAANPRFPGCGRPGSNPLKTVVTVHDVIPWSRPEYRKKLRTRIYQKNAQRALQNADAIIAVSEATALDLTDKIHFPYDHVKVIHEAASPVFTPEGRKHRHPDSPPLPPLQTTDYRLQTPAPTSSMSAATTRAKTSRGSLRRSPNTSPRTTTSTSSLWGPKIACLNHFQRVQ